jgi:hypothetical protein
LVIPLPECLYQTLAIHESVTPPVALNHLNEAFIGELKSVFTAQSSRGLLQSAVEATIKLISTEELKLKTLLAPLITQCQLLANHTTVAEDIRSKCTGLKLCC